MSEEVADRKTLVALIKADKKFRQIFSQSELEKV
jgi:hypothetical protein